MDCCATPTSIPPPLAGKRVAIIGYGNQGRAQALNLKDSGIDVVVGLRDGLAEHDARPRRRPRRRARSTKRSRRPTSSCCSRPTRSLGALYREIEPHLRHGAALGFSHGLAVRFGFIEPRADLDVFMVAPKGPGTALRSLYREGKGMVALWAVAQDAERQRARRSPSPMAARSAAAAPA